MKFVAVFLALMLHDQVLCADTPIKYTCRGQWDNSLPQGLCMLDSAKAEQSINRVMVWVKDQIVVDQAAGIFKCDYPINPDEGKIRGWCTNNVVLDPNTPNGMTPDSAKYIDYGFDAVVVK
ncbi:hypothetical protein PGT21_014350 [Puccinia graminis f. sp. tritici]|uniref:Uncharacterized protein n=2 Tax=Puccinia graminis f. sp. tritici TaxID=56615 RepID=E3KUB5_PUCGT|nr:uncharacterized protein PGTG_14605 [Puccinia graminis f. sp. tritici CRL 75-36-700-3]EFP87890.1 hypothetical protein PGTG_14605 [Puccinia graminis f. sp. tritici CRL 75-36-700-3]KAA1103325.1 hypothetical protein PGT21_014350 [Puccinia graminis f. sp. tritici]